MRTPTPTYLPDLRPAGWGALREDVRASLLADLADPGQFNWSVLLAQLFGAGGGRGGIGGNGGAGGNGGGGGTL